MYYVLILVLAAGLRALPCFQESTGRAHSPAARATNVVLAGAPEARGPPLPPGLTTQVEPANAPVFTPPCEPRPRKPSLTSKRVEAVIPIARSIRAPSRPDYRHNIGAHRTCSCRNSSRSDYQHEIGCVGRTEPDLWEELPSPGGGPAGW